LASALEASRAGRARVLNVEWEPISPNDVARQQIFPACKALGLQRATWLTFRRTYSSWAHEKGVPGKVVAQLMGHAKVDTMLNVYTQWWTGHSGWPRRSDRDCSQLFTIRKGRRR